jgi:four helix bundle protein
MNRIERFEDILSWQKARVLTQKVYGLTKQELFGRDFALKDQIRRASISTMSNIAEGYERGGDKEFHQFLALAKGSCGEVRSQLYVALDQGYVKETAFSEIQETAVETSRLISGLMAYLAKSDLRGKKFRTD